MSFEVFRKFPEIESAKHLADLLEENRISYRLEDYSNQADISFMGQNLDLKILIKARITDFPKIENLIDSSNDISLDQVDQGHYLFGFTDEELTEIIVKPDEWNNYDYKVAKLILDERGITVSEEFIENIKKQSYSKLSEKESYSSMWVVVGYISAFFGGILGFAIGLSLWQMRKKIPSGEKIFIYDKNTRSHGKRITIIGIIMLLIYIALRLGLIKNKFI